MDWAKNRSHPRVRATLEQVTALATSCNRLSNRFWGRLYDPFPSNTSLPIATSTTRKAAAAAQPCKGKGCDKRAPGPALIPALPGRGLAICPTEFLEVGGPEWVQCR